jgi:hypothetical protein
MGRAEKINCGASCEAVCGEMMPLDPLSTKKCLVEKEAVQVIINLLVN